MAAAPPGTAAARSPENGHAEQPSDETLERLAGMAADLTDLARVRVELVHERVRDASVHGKRALWAALVAGAATVAAVVLVVRGAAAGVAALFGPSGAWLADVLVGALVLAAVVVTHFARHAASQRRRVRRLERRLAAQEPARGGTS